MATETVKRCDIFDTKKDVGTYCLSIVEVVGDGCESSEVRNITLDLSPKALTRLLAAVDKGTTPPSKK